MAAEVVLTEEARKGIEGVKNVVITARMYRLVERLKDWPNVSGVKPLTGSLAGKYRLRTGDYRLQFHVETKRVKVEGRKFVKGKPVQVVEEVQRHRVVIEKVGHRDGFYDE